MLGYYAAVAGDWRYLSTHLDRLAGITPEEVRATAARWLRDDNRTVVVLVQREGAGVP